MLVNDPEYGYVLVPLGAAAVTFTPRVSLLPGLLAAPDPTPYWHEVPEMVAVGRRKPAVHVVSVHHEGSTRLNPVMA